MLQENITSIVETWTEHRSNQSIADELGVTSGTLLNCIKNNKLRYFGHIKIRQILGKLILEGTVKGQRNRGRPKWSLEKDVEDWTREMSGEWDEQQTIG